MLIREAYIQNLDSIVPLFDAYRQFYRQYSNLKKARTFLQDRLEKKESIDQDLQYFWRTKK